MSEPIEFEDGQVVGVVSLAYKQEGGPDVVYADAVAIVYHQGEFRVKDENAVLSFWHDEDFFGRSIDTQADLEDLFEELNPSEIFKDRMRNGYLTDQNALEAIHDALANDASDLQQITFINPMSSVHLHETQDYIIGSDPNRPQYMGAGCSYNTLVDQFRLENGMTIAENMEALDDSSERYNACEPSGYVHQAGAMPG